MNLLKRSIWVLVLFVAAGCASAQREPAPVQANQTSVSAPTTTTPDEASAEAANLLYRFAELVSAGELQAAADLLTPALRGAYAYRDYAPLRNTPTMEIVALDDMTGDPLWPADHGGREQRAADARVFAVDVRYRVLGIIDTRVQEGEIFHHKASVIRLTADGPWLISELSTASWRQLESRPPAITP